MKRVLLVLLTVTLGVVALRWATFDLQPVPEIAAIKVMRLKTEGRCGDGLTYLPTYAGGDLHALVEAGEAYCVEPRYGDGSALSVVVRTEEGLSTLGGQARAPARLRVRWTAPPPPGQEILLMSEGRVVARSATTELEVKLETPGLYHIELTRLVPTWYFGQARLTWIVTYPFTVLPGLA